MAIRVPRILMAFTVVCLVSWPCAYAATPAPAEDASAAPGCRDDRLDDLLAMQGRKVDRSSIFLVPLGMQASAMQLLVGSRVRALNESEAQRLMVSDIHFHAKPYLVQACFISLSASGSDADLFERAFQAAAINPIYYPDAKVLVAYTFGLAPRTASASPVAIIVESNGPIEEVRISAGAAE